MPYANYHEHGTYQALLEFFEIFVGKSNYMQKQKQKIL